MHQQHFDFKQFSIHQDRCAMKVGTDGVLLGAWSMFEKEKGEGKSEKFEDQGEGKSEKLRMLDIGAGTGLISLMLAQRFPSAQITAVEIDAEAADQCRANFQASPWADRLTIIPHSLHDAEPHLASASLPSTHEAEPPSATQQREPDDMGGSQLFDAIVSNPPFYNATLKPEDEGRAVARHKDSLPIAHIAAFAQRWLTPDGSLWLIYPTAYDDEVTSSCITHGLKPVVICDVLTKVGKPCKRRMAAFARQGAAAWNLPLLHQQLTIRRENGDYSEEYRHLVEPFYLRLS